MAATVHNFTPPPPASAARAVITARQPYANRYFAGTICQGRRGVTAAKRSQRPSSALMLFSEMVSENIGSIPYRNPASDSRNRVAAHVTTSHERIRYAV